jgi:hypothetical protein
MKMEEKSTKSRKGGRSTTLKSTSLTILDLLEENYLTNIEFVRFGWSMIRTKNIVLMLCKVSICLEGVMLHNSDSPYLHASEK